MQQLVGLVNPQKVLRDFCGMISGKKEHVHVPFPFLILRTGILKNKLLLERLNLDGPAIRNANQAIRANRFAEKPYFPSV